MDGLGSSDNCKNLLSFRFITSTTLGETIGGSIPECIWLLPNLQTLNLAGNGLRGKIGSISNMSSLSSMTLSHNYLTGVIPLWLQEKRVGFLDLSHNKFTGDLNGFKQQSRDLTADGEGTLKLAVNRLSGDLSDSFKKYLNLDILSGNLFSCAYIPNGDKNSEWTNCGSKEYDQSMFVMGGIFGLFLIGMLFYTICEVTSLNCFASSTNKNQSKPYTGWLESRLQDYHSLVRYLRYYLVENAEKLGERYLNLEYVKSTISFGYLLSNLMKSIFILSCISLLLSLPLYILKEISAVEEGDDDTKYTTHSHMYRWLWTMAFLSGRLPAIILLIVMFVCLIFFALMLNLVIDKNDLSVESLSDRHSGIQSPSMSLSETNQNVENTMILVIVWIIIITNIGIVGTVNGLYLWSTLVDLSPDIRSWIQVGFGFFSFIWNVIILRGALSARIKESRYGLWLFSCLSMMNNVIIPCIATALSSPNCYQVSCSFISPC